MSLPTPYYQDEAVTLLHGDCLEVLRTLPDASVDSVVTDPPYGLSFMGKKWDYDVPSVEIWAECLRVLKPGGYLLAFAGTRTQHRMACRIEDAGFEIRDMIAWVYGSGFPKSLDVSKAIDAARTEDEAPARVVGEWLRAKRQAAGFNQKEIAAHWPSVTGGLTGCVANWEGGKVPKWDQWLDLKALIGFGDEMDAEVWRLNGRKGTPGNERLDRHVTSPAGNEVYQPTQRVLNPGAPILEAAKTWEGWGTALKPALEPITMARKPLIGTVAENVLAHGTGGINVDGCRIPAERATGCLPNPSRGFSGGLDQDEDARPVNGRWPANLIHDGSEEVTGLFPETGSAKPARTGIKGGSNFFDGLSPEHVATWPADSGGSAARFFYTAKASKEDRDEGLARHSWTSAGDMTGGRAEGSAGLNNPRAGAGRTGGGKNIHPTVKPTALMQYLCRLVTQLGGVCLDPFMGSGSTGKAALLEGFQFIGVEREADYLPIAKDRVLSARRESVAVRHIDLQGKLL